MNPTEPPKLPSQPTGAPDLDEAAEQHVKQLMDTKPSNVASGTAVEPAAEPYSMAPLNIFEDNPDQEPTDNTVGLTPDESPNTTDETADPEIDKAVDDIAKAESDEVLKAQDQAAEPAVVMKPSFWERFKNGAADWWGDPRKRYVTLAALAFIVVATISIPTSRYFVLNGVGVRSHLSMKVLDSTTSLPLKNVNVSLAGQTAKTDVDGRVTLNHLKLGKQVLTIHKQAFADYTKTVTVGLSGVSLSDVELKAVGSQFTFNLVDFVSGKPVTGAQVASGDASALSDKNGKAILTVQPSDSQKLTVHASGDGYRTDSIDINPTLSTPTAVRLVSSAKEVFVSKQSGKYDLYTIDIDGKNRKVLLAGTGLETQNIGLTVSPDNNQVALVSSRDNQRNNDGYLLSTLTLINLATEASVTLDHAEQINLVGWVNGRLVYQLTVASASAANPNRQRIYSYDFASNKRQQIASANYFNGPLIIGNSIYYATAASGPGSTPGFNTIKPDGTGKQVLANKEVWSILRTGYNALTLQTSSGWVSYTVGDNSVKTATAPANFTSHDYVDNRDASHSLWVETRDGRGVLIDYNLSTSKDTVLVTQSGLYIATRWISNDTAIYRVVDTHESSDYVVSLSGGQPKKITDVTNTANAAGY
ncbi:MAG: hypothetical protein WC498_04165 [Candidatus Saccharimonadales bacterium]